MKTPRRTANRPFDVLLVEDSPGDARLTEEAFRDVGSQTRLHVITDGAAAMAFLRRQGEYALSPRPDLILLDLNLPKVDGREVLSQIKADDGLKQIPTIILTTSSAPTDVAMSYELQANCYLTKPVDLDTFDALMRGLHNFWLAMVTLPENPGRS